MKNIEIQIVNRIAAIRREQGLKITELAERAKISPSQISRIEHHQVSPPLSTLAKIAEALGTKVIDFFKDEEENLSILVHRHTETYETIEKYGKKRYLVPFFKNIYRLMEPVVFKIPPRYALDRHMCHGGEEFMFVLEGTVNFLYGRDIYTLNKYDAIYFKSNVPHGTFNEGDEEAMVLGVMTSKQNLYNGAVYYRSLKDHPSVDRKEYSDLSVG
jgi:transcriptional regulator with XRE-family HTH domain